MACVQVIHETIDPDARTLHDPIAFSFSQKAWLYTRYPPNIGSK